MKAAFSRWLHSFGLYIMKYGWSDMCGTMIPPCRDAAEPDADPLRSHHELSAREATTLL